MPKLDGSEKLIHTPYDAHEQAVRSSDGYEHAEYPKHVEVNGQTVTVNSAEEEAELEAGE